jgi:hypothetical protein
MWTNVLNLMYTDNCSLEKLIKVQFGLNIKWSLYLMIMTKKTKPNSVAFSPQANYTDRATAACRRS